MIVTLQELSGTEKQRSGICMTAIILTWADFALMINGHLIRIRNQQG